MAVAKGTVTLPAAAKDLGRVGLKGWRKAAADVAARPVATVTPLREQEVRELAGLVFLTLSAWYVGTSLARFLRSRSSGG
jgi:hypothetical protein